MLKGWGRECFWNKESIEHQAVQVGFSVCRLQIHGLQVQWLSASLLVDFHIPQRPSTHWPLSTNWRRSCSALRWSSCNFPMTFCFLLNRAMPLQATTAAASNFHCLTSGHFRFRYAHLRTPRKNSQNLFHRVDRRTSTIHLYLYCSIFKTKCIWYNFYL
jgi:hypothetical protein